MTMMLGSASRRLGQYELISYLGSGGMSDVYVALHTGLRKRVALKLLRPALRFDSGAVTRFLREGECAARVRHPHVVDVSDVGLDQGVPYLVMELLEGETLAQKLSREGPLEVERAVDLLLPILDAVAAAHAAGVLHCDLKPANILLARGGDGSVRPKLLDFGIARMQEHATENGRSQGPLGTPQYMAPEQARGEPVDERSDQYAIASVLFELLTGYDPFPGLSVDAVLAQVATGKHPRLCKVCPSLPRGLDAVLARATARRPGRRYESVSALALALVPYASERTQRLWLSRADRDGVVSAQLLSGSFRADGCLEPEHTQVIARTGRARSRIGVPATLRVFGAAAMLGLGLWAGLGVTRGEAEELSPALALSVAASDPRASDAPAPRRLVRLVPASARAELDGVDVGHGSFLLPSLGPGLHELRVSAPDHVARIVLFRGAFADSKVVLEPQR